MSFAAGELAPEVDGRIDLEEYSIGCKRCENFIPTLQGPAVRRAGTRYVNAVKAQSNRTWLMRFEFNVEQAYILEFGNSYIRFYLNHGQLLSGMSAYEIVSPYATADLTDADGNFLLNFEQSGDVVYITHALGTFPVYKLSRLGATSWTITAVSFVGGPFEDVDPAQTITVYSSAATGSGITLTASSSIFQASDVGTIFYLENKLNADTTQWEVGKAILLNAIRRSDGKYYQALNAATTGSVRPTHTTGAVYDGDTGVQWQYLHAGTGYVKITAYTSGTQVTADVISRLPAEVVAAPNATTRWAYGSWGTRFGYPTHVTFFKERLTFVRSSDQRVWLSVVADFENFAARDKSGQVVDDQAIRVDIVGRKVNRIQWVVPSEVLLVGSAGGEHIIRELTADRPLSPSNITSVQISEYGSAPVSPVRVGNSVLFVQRAGRKVRELAFSPDAADGYGSIDLAVLAQHLLPRGKYLTQIKFQQEPHSVVWAVRNDGLLIGIRYNSNRKAVAWFRCPIGGNAVVESIETIPAPDGDRDELWLIVRRTINGSTTR